MSHAIRRVIIVAATAAILAPIGGFLALNAGGNNAVASAPRPLPSVSPTTDPNASPVPVPSVMPTIATDAHGHPDYCKNQTIPFTGPPAVQFGGDTVMAAYCQMVAYTLDQSTWLPALLPTKTGRTIADFAGVKPQMTASMQATWDRQVTLALAGNPQAAAKVQALTFYNLPDLRAADGSTVVDKKFSPGRAFVEPRPDGAPALGMTITVTADIRTANGMRPSGKTVTYILTPATNPAGQWLVADVTAQPLTDN